MTQAFDLEQDILKCWNITDDIGEILDDMEAGHMDSAEAITALRAYQKVYQRRFEKCFQRFEAYNTEAWAFRRRVQELEKDLAEQNQPVERKGRMPKHNKSERTDQ